MGKKKNAYRCLTGKKLKGKCHLEDLDEDGKIELKRS
jgi:hypothetical protein